MRRFLEEVSLTGRVQYLTGPPSRLRAIWRAYHVVAPAAVVAPAGAVAPAGVVAPAGAVAPAGSGGGEFDRFASVVLLDGEGRERVLFQREQLTPESLAHDIRKLQAG